jgi:predicted enzyme related to lactoylglutathione lyase
MGSSPIRAVMFFASDPEIVATWWASNLGEDAPVIRDGEFRYFIVDGIEFGFHLADGHNPIGASPVIYLSITNFEQTRTHLLELGCAMHRGPLTIDDSRRICQLIDPFGNTFGIDGF